ncbi:MAG: EAL domain-containing protein (putative c-di-GMP-specific phosphodiesterase class I) [Psychromonas sp.]|jgi:EAL domain-containing protein (putative c-di-GMP-specific phosphodiesterase class I)/GGDEF domain-containing protein|uniref:putative bifunctional diguanylate cyclase/phosphodiesterase n=1 Tax=Psychromonas sp. TaxID=1884585 RepID=UPI0039E3731D
MDKKLYVWIKKHHRRIEPLMLPIIVLLVTGVYTLVYMTGGSKYVYAHTMYIPILIAGMVFGIRGGVLIGLLAGLVLGPLMPLEVSTGEAQAMLDWLFRCGFFILIGFICGATTDSVRSYLRHIKWLAHHDPFSGLPNRAALFEKLKEILYDQSNAYIFALISIENEKELLPVFGFSIVDNAIVQLLKRLQKKTPQILSVFRINTAQLGVLVRLSSNWEDQHFFDELSTVFREPILFEEIPIHLDIRMGSTVLIDCNEPPERSLQKAESALAEACYKACDHISFTPAIATTSRENIIMQGELQNALTNKQLALHYQPKVVISTGAVHSVEALLRWNHPQKGNIPPGIFIPRAEESTLINQITFYVLNEAMIQMVLWKKSGINIPVAVNISAHNLLQSDFSNVVFFLLEYHGLGGEQLELEITEGALMLDTQRAIVELNKLSEAKITLSIDDFGTGYSSLQYLHQLPVSFIKIDQSFVGRLPTDKSAISIVDMAISMAHKMHIKTIAEGIDDKQKYDFLKNIGCDLAQGYIISRPLPGNEYAKWHRQNNGVFR